MSDRTSGPNRDGGHGRPETGSDDPSSASAAMPPPARLVEAPVERRRPRWALWAVLACLILAASAGWWHWSGRAAAPGRADARAPAGREAVASRVPVQVATVAREDVPVFFDSLGLVQAFNSVTVRSRVEGELVEIAFQEGQTVREGDLLARIDPRPYQAALDQAVARKAQTEATLSGTRLDLERTQKLASQEFASRQQLDQQRASLGAQSAQLKSEQAAIDIARTQLDYATIRAPISGRLGIRLLDQGNIVRSGDQTGIVEIAQLQPISVLFTAPEGQLGAIAAAKQAGDVKVLALAPDGRTVLGEGVLALINNTVDAASGTVRLKATFPNAESSLWPGLSVNTRLLARTVKGALAVPDAALLRGQNELFVFVVRPDGRAEKRVVRAGVFSDGRVVITDGLREGDSVVVAGQSRLQPGSVVEIEPGDRPAAPPGEDARAGQTGSTASARP
ncbi:efflux RND transporter periplasmic adaptor subunit [Enterovirga sp.]|jgi:multidrug efflux system membrane fusion protein|uniref:efflux RND transporter periplasmic adaptor subunit n=1 Tax=Enterovirga sp. TaxID=2026350 RepID=UPI0026203956|nr:efflux RND transporter periplasmic adaptor subunit [Enterovirga sp.]MDB5592834.1 family efflux transporter, subunit [Enterovirga sp.]